MPTALRSNDWRLFEGDALISHAAYEAVMQAWYVQWLSAIERALDTGGVRITSVTSEQQRRILAAAYHVDELLDASSDKDQASRVAEQLVGVLQEQQPVPGDALAAVAVHLLLNALRGDSWMRERVGSAAAQIVGIARTKRRALTPLRLERLLRQEALATAALVLAPYADAVDSPSKHRTHVTLTRLLVGGVLLDSFLDRREDNRDGVYGRRLSRAGAALFALCGIGHWLVAVVSAPRLAFQLIVPDVQMTLVGRRRRRRAERNENSHSDRFPSLEHDHRR